MKFDFREAKDMKIIILKETLKNNEIIVLSLLTHGPKEVKYCGPRLSFDQVDTRFIFIENH